MQNKQFCRYSFLPDWWRVEVLNCRKNAICLRFQTYRSTKEWLISKVNEMSREDSWCSLVSVASFLTKEMSLWVHHSREWRLEAEFDYCDHHILNPVICGLPGTCMHRGAHRVSPERLLKEVIYTWKTWWIVQKKRCSKIAMSQMQKELVSGNVFRLRSSRRRERVSQESQHFRNTASWR
jgi:hypothetical protein